MDFCLPDVRARLEIFGAATEVPENAINVEKF